jgi:hypothetical protein
VDWVHETMNPQGLRSTMDLKWRCRNSSHRSSARQAVLVGNCCCELGETGREASRCSPEKKLAEAATGKAGQQRSTDSMAGVRRVDGSG